MAKLISVGGMNTSGLVVEGSGADPDVVTTEELDEALSKLAPAIPAPDGKTYGIKDKAWVEVTGGGGGTITDVQVNGQSVVTDGVADITVPDPPAVTTEEVTAMFTFSPQVAKPRVWMRKSAFSDPEIVIEIENASDGTSDLTITAAGGFGAYFDHTGNKAIPIPGINPDTGMGALYPITITGETDQAQTVIMVPAQVQSATIKYTLGQTTAPRASYWVNIHNLTSYPFELENTPVSDLFPSTYGSGRIRINGQMIGMDFYPYEGVRDLTFGSSYNTITEIPEGPSIGAGLLSSQGMPGGTLDISGLKNVTKYGDYSFSACGFSNLQIRDIDSSLITSIGSSVFEYSYIGTVYSDTQAGGEAFRAKFPNLSTATIVVNS